MAFLQQVGLLSLLCHATLTTRWNEGEPIHLSHLIRKKKVETTVQQYAKRGQVWHVLVLFH